MIGTGSLRWLAVILVCALLQGCASYYRLDVSGDQADQVRSVFLIVADKNPLGNDGDAASLIRPDKVGDYLLFAQFDPSEGNPLRWRQETLDSRSDMLSVSISDDLRVLKLRVNKALIEAYGGLTVVAVGHGSEGWYAEAIDSGKVRLEEGIRFDCAAARFVRRPLGWTGQ